MASSAPCLWADENGHIKAGSNVPGIEALKDADMMFLFLRFLAPSDAWMKQFTAYLDRVVPCLVCAPPRMLLTA